MIKKEKFLPALVTGFSLAVLSIVPVIQVATCCILAPLAGMFGVNLFYLQMKNNEGFELKPQDGFQIGLMVGIISGFFESLFQSLLIFVSKDNPVYDSILMLQRYVSELQVPDIIWNISKEIDERRFSSTLSFILFVNASIINSIFATIGALISVSSINKRKFKDSNF